MLFGHVLQGFKSAICWRQKTFFDRVSHFNCFEPCGNRFASKFFVALMVCSSFLTLHGSVPSAGDIWAKKLMINRPGFQNGKNGFNSHCCKRAMNNLPFLSSTWSLIPQNGGACHFGDGSSIGEREGAKEGTQSSFASVVNLLWVGFFGLDLCTIERNNTFDNIVECARSFSRKSWKQCWGRICSAHKGEEVCKKRVLSGFGVSTLRLDWLRRDAKIFWPDFVSSSLFKGYTFSELTHSNFFHVTIYLVGLDLGSGPEMDSRFRSGVSKASRGGTCCCGGGYTATPPNRAASSGSMS